MIWDAQCGGEEYLPEGFGAEGFVHCTDGLEALAASGDRHLRSDPRPHVALEIDLDRVPSGARYEADPPMFPHVFGPIPVGAVVSVRAAVRASDGTFTGFGPNGLSPD